ARSRLSPHRTTGGTGTRRTWTLASVVAPQRKLPQPPGATWRTSSKLSSHSLESGERYAAPRRRARSIRVALMPYERTRLDSERIVGNPSIEPENIVARKRSLL